MLDFITVHRTTNHPLPAAPATLQVVSHRYGTDDVRPVQPHDDLVKPVSLLYPDSQAPAVDHGALVDDRLSSISCREINVPSRSLAEEELAHLGLLEEPVLDVDGGVARGQDPGVEERVGLEARRERDGFLDRREGKEQPIFGQVKQRWKPKKKMVKPLLSMDYRWTDENKQNKKSRVKMRSWCQ